jgi:hypothetical protein
MSADELSGWRETTAKQSIVEFVAAVTDPDSPDFVPERDRVAVFDNDGTLWTEQPVYAQLVFALDRAAELGHPTSLEELHAGDVYDLSPHRVIGSVGETEFRIGDDGPELVKSSTVQVIDDGPQKPSSIHRHVGQRPILAAGNTDGDLPMLQWTAASPGRTLQLVVHHTDGDREYAYDRDPILGSGTGQILAAAAEHKWTVIDMAADWATVHPDTRRRADPG